tara:strand:- start:522 stop:716 length:195 start_codon:yes stop_codon:yes gene_type:complete
LQTINKSLAQGDFPTHPTDGGLLVVDGPWSGQFPALLIQGIGLLLTPQLIRIQVTATKGMDLFP